MKLSATLDNQYAALIQSKIADYQDEITSVLTPAIRRHFRTDALPSDFDNRIRALEIRTRGAIIDADMAVRMYGIGRQVLRKNNRQLREILNILADDLVGEEVLTQWFDENVSLIRSLTEEQLDEARTLIENLAAQNVRVELVAKKLQERFEVSKWRARLIARDQIGKLNGRITQLQHQRAGVNQYVWTTVGDERVRPSHSKLDGTLQSWDQAPEVTPGQFLHPSEDIQCRCFPYPYLPQLGPLGVPSNLRTA